MKTKLEDQNTASTIRTKNTRNFNKNTLGIADFKKKKVTWDSQDITKAFTSRYFKVRNTLKCPLPHTSFLQRWAAR